MTQNVDDELLTVDEVAKILRVNPQTVRNWIDRGELPEVRIGKRRVRVRRSDLEEFVGGGGMPIKRHTPAEEVPPQMLVRPEVADGLQAFGEALHSLSDATLRLADVLR